VFSSTQLFFLISSTLFGSLHVCYMSGRAAQALHCPNGTVDWKAKWGDEPFADDFRGWSNTWDHDAHSLKRHARAWAKRRAKQLKRSEKHELGEKTDDDDSEVIACVSAAHKLEKLPPAPQPAPHMLSHPAGQPPPMPPHMGPHAPPQMPMPVPPTAPQPPPQQPEWRSYKDPRGYTYWHNTRTNKTQWQTPPGYEHTHREQQQQQHPKQEGDESVSHVKQEPE
jgi:hypothetical protein